MQKEIKNLYNEFEKIKNRGWIKSVNKYNNGVGLTFESLLGIQSNELEIPDYKGSIELKTRRVGSQSYVTLFSCKPDGKYYHEVERIKDTYGYPHRILKKYKVLNNSVYGNKKNIIGNKYFFELEICKKERKIYLLIYNRKEKLLEREVYWDFDILKEKIERKLKYLALVKAYSKKNRYDGYEYFKYFDIKIYNLKSFEIFLNLLKNGIIRINFKLNIRTTVEKIGQIHDHGTSFDILEKDFDKLFFLLN